MYISEEGKRVSDVLATWFTILSVLAGGIFALAQYLHLQENERLTRTMGYYAQFRETNLLQYRLALQQRLESQNSAIVGILTEQGASQQAINQNYANFVLANLANDDKSQEALMGIMEMLESVAICSQEQLCEEYAVRALFGNYGKSFFRIYYPYICQKRSSWNDPSIGLKLEQFFNPKSVGKSCAT